VERFVETFRI